MWDNAESPPHEHLWSKQKNLPCFPIMEHFNTAGHSIHDALKVSRSFWSATQIIRIFFRYLFYYFQVFLSLCFKLRTHLHAHPSPTPTQISFSYTRFTNSNVYTLCLTSITYKIHLFWFLSCFLLLWYIAFDEKKKLVLVFHFYFPANTCFLFLSFEQVDYILHGELFVI